MPDETVQQKAERQARLSHVMGVMRLQDKVDKLERDASKITYPRGMRQTRSGPAADISTHNPRHETRPKPRAETGPGLNSSTDASANDVRNARKPTVSIRLVDASVLIFSLRSVHNWSRDQSTCVVIPLEAINTLDLLKKGDDPINLAARKATRWLEDKIAISPQDGDAMFTHPAAGIFAQKESFRSTSAQIEKARAAAPASDAVDMFSTSDAPRYLRELLSVCIYCQQACSTDADFAVAIAYPPAHLQDKMIEARSSSNDKPCYLNRTDGRATEAWLDAYRIPFELAPTSKTWTGEKLSSRFRNEITAGQNVGSSDELLGSKAELGMQQRRKGSPTPSVASTSASTSSFQSELSRPSLFRSRSPHHRQECRMTCSSPFKQVRGLFTCSQQSSAAATPSVDSHQFDASEERNDESEDKDGPIIARPSSAASSHTSFVSTLTSSTIDDWGSSQASTLLSSSHGGMAAKNSTRIIRHPPAVDSVGCDGGSNTNMAAAAGSGVARLTSRTLHKTKSGANKMEEYLRRLEAGTATGTGPGAGASANASASADAVERSGTGTPTPTNRIG